MTYDMLPYIVGDSYSQYDVRLPSTQTMSPSIADKNYSQNICMHVNLVKRVVIHS